MLELWNREEFSSFSDMPLRGEGGPAGAWGDAVRSKYVIPVRKQEHLVGKDTHVTS